MLHSRLSMHQLHLLLAVCLAFANTLKANNEWFNLENADIVGSSGMPRKTSTTEAPVPTVVRRRRPTTKHQIVEMLSVSAPQVANFTRLLFELEYLPAIVPQSNVLYVDALKAFQRDYNITPTGVLDENTLAFLEKGKCVHKKMTQHRPHHLKKVYRYILYGHAVEVGYEATHKIWIQALTIVSNITQIEFRPVSSNECSDLSVTFTSNESPAPDVHFSGKDKHGTLACVDSKWYRTSHGSELFYFIYVDREKCWQEANSIACRSNSFRPSLLLTLVHELGHVIGLEHVSDPNSIMYTFYMDNRNIHNSTLSHSDRKMFYEHANGKSYTEISTLPPPIIAHEAAQQQTEPKEKRDSGNELDLCDGKYTGFYLLDDFIYIIKGAYLWILDHRSMELLSTQPTSIRVIWPSYNLESIRCMYKNEEQDLFLAYEKQLYDVRLNRTSGLTQPIRFCFSVQDVGIISFQERFQKLHTYKTDNTPDIPNVSKKLGVKNYDETHITEMDFMMKKDLVLYYFKEGKMWRNTAFNSTASFKNIDATRIVDFWLPRYCSTRRMVEPITFLKLSNLARKISEFSDSTFLNKKTL